MILTPILVSITVFFRIVIFCFVEPASFEILQLFKQLVLVTCVFLRIPSNDLISRQYSRDIYCMMDNEIQFLLRVYCSSTHKRDSVCSIGHKASGDDFSVAKHVAFL